MSPPFIRRSRRDDQASVGRLWLRLFEDHARLDDRFTVAGDALARWQNDFPHWLQDEHQRVFVAMQGSADCPVGFIRAHRWAPPPIYGPSEEIYIDELYVLPEARGSGLGRLLVEAVRMWALELRAVRLRFGVLVANEAGQIFWERHEATPLALTYTIELDRPEQNPSTQRTRRIGF